MVDFSGSVLVSTTGVVAAGGATPLSAAGGGNGGALATRAGGACGAGSAADGMRASSRLSCGGWVVSGATCSTTVIRPRGRGTAGERSTETSTPATKTTQAPPAPLAANDRRSRCVRAINPIQKITADKSAAVLSRDHNTTRRGSACVTLILTPGPHQRLRRRAGNVDFHDQPMVDACLRRPRCEGSLREIGGGRFCDVARFLRRAGDGRGRCTARAVDHRPHIAVAFGGEMHAVGLLEFSRADGRIARADIFD